MYTIIVSKELKEACPVFAGAAIYAEVKNTSYCEGLWEEIQSFTEMLTATTRLEDIKKQPVIAATREAYKRCGKRSREISAVGRSVTSQIDAGDCFVSD